MIALGAISNVSHPESEAKQQRRGGFVRVMA